MFLGNELATVPIAVVCIALLVRVTLTTQRYSFSLILKVYLMIFCTEGK